MLLLSSWWGLRLFLNFFVHSNLFNCYCACHMSLTSKNKPHSSSTLFRNKIDNLCSLKSSCEIHQENLPNIEGIMRYNLNIYFYGNYTSQNVGTNRGSSQTTHFLLQALNMLCMRRSSSLPIRVGPTLW